MIPMKPKPWYQSKSIVVGGLTVFGTVVEALTSGNTSQSSYVLIALGTIQILLRLFTDQPIAPVLSPPNPPADR